MFFKHPGRDFTRSRKLPFRKVISILLSIVRFRITDEALETVVTNLDANQFPPPELKKLYHMRWGIETSFRELKYTVGLLHFHAKRVHPKQFPALDALSLLLYFLALSLYLNDIGLSCGDFCLASK